MDPVFSGKKVFMKFGPVRRALAAACVLPLLLAGCSDAEPTPEIPDPTTPSPSAEETDTGPVEPTLPPEAEGDGVEAAEAFISYYFALVDHARATGQTAPLSKIALKSCSTCGGVVDVINQVSENQGNIQGGDQAVRDIQLRQLGGIKDVRTFQGTAKVDSTEQAIEGSGDTDLDGIYPAGTLNVSVLVVKGKQGWRFAEWSVIS